jgi:threonine dehydrogenase-like Zn-dependent dehydrogenase
MRAIVKLEAGPGAVRCIEHPDPRPGLDEVVIRVRRAGLCHTDLSMIEYNAAARTGYRPRFPLVLGHEFAGEIEETGAPVLVSPHVTCRACRFCLAGRSMLCRSRRILGLDVDGAFAEYVAVPERNITPLPHGIDWDVAGLAEPLTVALHALERVPVGLGDKVAVNGPGGIGLCLVAALTRTGAGTVIAVGREQDRRQLDVARSLGAITATTEDDIEEVDIAFETAGAASAVQLARSITRPGGTIGIVGLPATPVELDAAALAFGEQTLVGIRAYDLSTWRRTAALLAPLADQLRPLVTYKLPLSAFEDAVAHVEDRSAIKVLLDPTYAG